ncbi:MAG: beta-N-acetylhexosaminidase [Clostridiaceae bacterium]|jgi:hexosaminidase|nr:beta-N-acetylhexosaminidase [Clostridiaceae bacterium]
MKIIPKPHKITEVSGGTFIFSAATVLPDGYSVIREKLAAISSSFKSVEPNEITLKLSEDCDLKGEEYRLEITPQKVEITAKNYKGLFYGTQTFIQLAFEHVIDKVSAMPCVIIEDMPRYPFRAFMLDVSRHFFCIEDIKRQIDLISALKINRLHFHFCDDQGFRIEIKKYPKLTEKGAYRAQTRGDGKPHGGFYTQDEIKDLVAYAALRAVEIVPEFEIPGHCTAVLAAYPELSCRGEGLPVGDRFGIFMDIYCGGNAKTVEFIKDVLSEIAELFPCEYIHLGGDEAPKMHWRQCPKCRAAIEGNGLKNEEEFQAYLTNEAIKHIKQYGKTAIVWNESMNSGMLDESAVCQYWWENESKIAAAANRGRKLIVSKTAPFYLDYPYGSNSVKDIYKFNLSLPGLDGDGEKNILGFDAPLWTEYVSEADIDFKAYPRLIAAADRGWTDCAPDYADFKSRLENILSIFSGYGVKYATLVDAEPGYFRARKSLRKWKRISGGDKFAEAVYRAYIADKRKNEKR